MLLNFNQSVCHAEALFAARRLRIQRDGVLWLHILKQENNGPAPGMLFVLNSIHPA